MENFEVTEKHPYLKKGLILDQHGGEKDSAYFVGDSAVWITSKDLKIFESDGWVKKVQVFTKNDMIQFGKWCDTGNQENEGVYEKALNKWIKNIKIEHNNHYTSSSNSSQ